MSLVAGVLLCKQIVFALQIICILRFWIDRISDFIVANGITFKILDIGVLWKSQL